LTLAQGMDAGRFAISFRDICMISAWRPQAG
jgi:hypothetical protein